MLALYVLMVTVVVVMLLTVLLLTLRIVSGKSVAGYVQPVVVTTRGSKRKIAFSLPVALSTVLVLLWCCRDSLHLPLPAPRRTAHQDSNQ